ncbi:MAG TPA: cupredoxin family copper-binding protein [Dehalococcoidia bacterium]|nr:cupredoxin family copper-binding protein [Dehalococcoidia bacterium]
MNWKLAPLALVAGLALAGLSACGDDDDDDAPADTETQEETVSTEEPAEGDDSAEEPSGSPGEVTIQDFAFAPADLQVNVGDVVTWTNSDPTAHTVTADEGVFDSGSISGDGTFEFTFDTAGEFAYHCEFHTGMTGTITVGEGAALPADDEGSQPISLGDGY